MPDSVFWWKCLETGDQFLMLWKALHIILVTFIRASQWRNSLLPVLLTEISMQVKIIQGKKYILDLTNYEQNLNKKQAAELFRIGAKR